MPPEHEASSTSQPLWLQALMAVAEPKIHPANPTSSNAVPVEAILSALPVAVCLEEWSQNMLTCANQQALAFFGLYLKEKQFGLAFAAERVYPGDRTAYQAMRQELLQTQPGETTKTLLRLRNARNDWRWMSCSLTVLNLSRGGLPERVLWCLQDVTEDKQNEERLLQALYQDPLTGLYSRMYFDIELARLSGGRDYPVGVIMIDVDLLKKVNDNLGHAAGDALLQRAGKAIKNAFRHGDVVARIGGDEFVVLLPRASQQITRAAADRIMQQIQMMNRQHPEVKIEISLGMAVADHGQPLKEVLELADQRMYQEKIRHKQHP